MVYAARAWPSHGRARIASEPYGAPILGGALSALLNRPRRVIAGLEAAIVDDAAAARWTLSLSPLKPLRRHFSSRSHGIWTQKRGSSPPYT